MDLTNLEELAAWCKSGAEMAMSPSQRQNFRKCEELIKTVGLPVVRSLEWLEIGQLCGWATPEIGASYAIQEFGSWTKNPFQLTIRESDDAKTEVTFHSTIDEAKAYAQANYESRVRSALNWPALCAEEPMTVPAARV